MKTQFRSPEPMFKSDSKIYSTVLGCGERRILRARWPVGLAETESSQFSKRQYQKLMWTVDYLVPNGQLLKIYTSNFIQTERFI